MIAEEIDLVIFERLQIKTVASIAFTILAMWIAIPVTAQHAFSGKWEGYIDIRGQKLSINFHIKEEAGNYFGKLDIPQQGAKGLQLTKLEQKRDSVSIEFNTGQGIGKFNGSFQKDTLITGSYTQGGYALPFKVTKALKNDSIGIGEELVIQNGDKEIGGTLVLPEDTSSVPLVIMISGSGAQNRDSEIYNFKIFAHLADYLEQNGIASFRYDDRQIGESTGSFSDATLDTLVSDVKKIIQNLNGSAEFKFSDIILLGHSQGGIVAGKLATDDYLVDKLILMASPGVSLRSILSYQVRQAYSKNSYSSEDIDKEISARESLMVAIRENKEVENAKVAYKNQYINMLNNLSEKQRNSISDIDAAARRQADLLESAYSTPQMQSLLFYDPTRDLKKIDIPVLVIFGEKDTQVTEDLNRGPVTDALNKAGSDFEIKSIPNANHLFQKAKSGRVNEYSMLDKHFVQGFLESISSWIKK